MVFTKKAVEPEEMGQILIAYSITGRKTFLGSAH
jgi:hypothetical protein